MSYTTINYYEFAPYKVERIGDSEIKKYSWDKIEHSQPVELGVKLYDDRTAIVSITRKKRVTGSGIIDSSLRLSELCWV